MEPVSTEPWLPGLVSECLSMFFSPLSSSLFLKSSLSPLTPLPMGFLDFLLQEGSLLPRALPSRLAEVNMGGFPPTCTTRSGWSRQGESEQGNPATFPGSKPCENPAALTCGLFGPGIPCGVAGMGCQHPVSLLKICIFPVA